MKIINKTFDFFIIFILIVGLNSCRIAPYEKFVDVHDEKDFDFLLGDSKEYRDKYGDFFAEDVFFPHNKEIIEKKGFINDLSYCGTWSSLLRIGLFKSFYLYGLILDIGYQESYFNEEIDRLLNSLMRDYDDNSFNLYDDTKVLFNYDVIINSYPCCIVCPNGQYKYAIIDWESHNIKYVYLKYIEGIRYSSKITFDNDILPINFERNESIDTYDGYYFSTGSKDNYWHWD